MYGIIYKVVWAILGIIMIVYYAKRKHTVSSALIGMTSGAAALVLLHYFGGYIGYAPPLNLFNTAVSLVLGIPGAVLVTAVNFFG